MLRTKYKGYKHERKVSGCLQNFDHVTTVHESLGGLEHMERPPRSFERKLDPATLGIQMAHWEWSGLVYQRTWFDVCYICHIFYAPASQPVGIETWVHGISWVPWQTGHANESAACVWLVLFHARLNLEKPLLDTEVVVGHPIFSTEYRPSSYFPFAETP